MSETPQTVSGAAKLFDLRLLIGGLFTVYGVVLTIVGLTDSKKEIDRAAGVHINLWIGLGMLVLGVVFLIWSRTRPLRVEAKDPEVIEPTDGTGTGSRDGR